MGLLIPLPPGCCICCSPRPDPGFLIVSSTAWTKQAPSLADFSALICSNVNYVIRSIRLFSKSLITIFKIIKEIRI